MKNIGIAILAVCLATLGSMAAQAQYDNTAYGDGALQSNSYGSYNSAFGVNSLYSNNGEFNTAIGMYSLYSNSSGSNNAAVGTYSLYSNSTGSSNTAVGDSTLTSNTSGYGNTATGEMSLNSNITGLYNTATGDGSLNYNSTGSRNTATGTVALYYNTSGSFNIGVGFLAGFNNPAGASNNIDIGSEGSANDSNPTIRIGTPGTQKAFFVAGVRGVTTGVKDAIEVMIDQNGQLGTVNSSIRFKEDVHDMAAASDGLLRLRPVTYRYKEPYADGSKPIDYGLIAEEVAEVYPDLVARDADGQIQTVQYQKLTPMLLNEVQKEHKLLEEQEATIGKQGATIELLEKRLAALETMLPSAKAEAQLAEK
jgi:hypothetical protein